MGPGTRLKTVRQLADGLDRFVTSSRGVAWLGITAAFAAIAGALAFAPVPGDPDHLTVLGHAWRQQCSFRGTTGLPCSSCGMTRAWVWAIRGDLATAARYSIAGIALLGGVLANGVVQAAHLAGVRAPRRLARLYLILGIAWMALWLGSWMIRLLGGYPLP